MEAVGKYLKLREIYQFTNKFTSIVVPEDELMSVFKKVIFLC
jgi:hypothetical protein